MENQEMKRLSKVCSLEELLYPQATARSGNYELSEEEKALAIKEAQDKKTALLKYEEDMERRKEWEKALSRKWTYNEMLIYIRYKAEKNSLLFEIDEKNHALVKLLCRYFTSDEAFITEAKKVDVFGQEFSLTKGILLSGPIGTGKTTLMGLFRGNQKRSFMTASCRKIADQFKSNGEAVLHKWSYPISYPNSADTFYQNQLGVCFDDLGTESVKRNFGDQVNVMADVILNRYDSDAVPFHWTHATTNLTADEIETCYGPRVRSRMREMFNVLTLEGEDRRK